MKSKLEEQDNIGTEEIPIEELGDFYHDLDLEDKK